MKFNEQLIKEKRTIEASKKEYMGPKGKLAIISRFLGTEIIQQGEGNRYIKYDNFWEGEKKDFELVDENTPINSLGFYFYGLNYSCNIEIYYIENEKLIKVIYEGQKAYEEINGELESYVPGKWEGFIENFYNLAKEKYSLIKDKEKQRNKKIFEEKKISILDKIKKVWGV